MEYMDETFITIDDEGNEVECEILFTFRSDKTGKDYIVYTDNTLDEDGSTKVYASSYDPEEDDTPLLPIETDEEWALIEKIVNELSEEMLMEQDGDFYFDDEDDDDDELLCQGIDLDTFRKMLEKKIKELEELFPEEE